MTPTPAPELQALLAELEAAVRSGDRPRARGLARELLERLDREIAEHERLRGRVVELMAGPPRRRRSCTIFTTSCATTRRLRANG